MVKPIEKDHSKSEKDLKEAALAEPRHCYINKADFEMCVDSVDLGEHMHCEVYLYPYKDDLGDLLRFVEYSALEQAREELKLVKANEELLIRDYEKDLAERDAKIKKLKRLVCSDTNAMTGWDALTAAVKFKETK